MGFYHSVVFLKINVKKKFNLYMIALIKKCHIKLLFDNKIKFYRNKYLIVHHPIKTINL
jgi:hypothetical protein